MKNMTTGTIKIETSMIAMVVSTLMESTSCVLPNSSRTIGFTTVIATTGRKRQSSSMTMAWNDMDIYSSLRVTSFTVSRGIW